MIRHADLPQGRAGRRLTRRRPIRLCWRVATAMLMLVSTLILPAAAQSQLGGPARPAMAPTAQPAEAPAGQAGPAAARPGATTARPAREGARPAGVAAQPGSVGIAAQPGPAGAATRSSPAGATARPNPASATARSSPAGATARSSPAGAANRSSPAGAAARPRPAVPRAGQARRPATPPAATPPVTAAAPAAEPAPPEPTQGSATGLPLPRFVPLRSDRVNLRVGPDVRFPVEWRYERRDLPVQIIREHEQWRRIRDVDGTEGWVHQSNLTPNRRTYLIRGNPTGEVQLRRRPESDAPAVARLRPGVIGRLRACEPASEWCEVQAGDTRGFVQRGAIFGVLPGEKVE